MANDEELLLIRIEATQTKMEKELNKALNNLSSAEKRIARSQAGIVKQIEANWARVGKVIGVGALAGIATGLGSMAKQAISTAAAIGDTAIQAGVGVERLQALRFAASQSGGSFELMDNALTALNKNLGDFVNTGGGKAAATFKALGIDKMIQGGTVRNAEQAFDAIVRGLQGVQSEAQKSAYLAGVFGKEAGPKLLQLVNEGSKGIADLENKARSLGIVLSADMVRGAKDADDKLTALFDVIKAQGTAAVAAFAPEIGDLAQSISDSLPKLISWVEKWADWFGLVKMSPAAKLRAEISDLTDQITAIEEKRAQTGGFRGAVNRILGTENYDKAIAELKAARSKLQAELELSPVISTAARKIDTSVPMRGKATGGKAWSPENVQSTAKVDISDIKDPFAFVAEGQKRIAQITAEGEALGMSGAAADAYLWKLDALAKITEEFGGVTEAQAQQVEAVAAAMQKAGEDAEAYRATLDALQDAQQQDAEAAAMRVRQIEFLKDGLADVAAAGLYGFDSLQSAGSRFLAMLGEMILKTQVIKPLLDSLGSGAGGGGGFLGDIFGFAKKALGFASGGYTGQGAVGQPAGIVHKGEVVFSQADIRRWGGVAQVEALRRGIRQSRSDGGVSVSVIHDGSTAIRYEKTSAGEIEIIAESVVDRRAASVVAADMRRSNSSMAKATKATVAAPRKKA